MDFTRGAICFGSRGASSGTACKSSFEKLLTVPELEPLHGELQAFPKQFAPAVEPRMNGVSGPSPPLNWRDRVMASIQEHARPRPNSSFRPQERIQEHDPPDFGPARLPSARYGRYRDAAPPSNDVLMNARSCRRFVRPPSSRTAKTNIPRLVPVRHVIAAGRWFHAA